MKTDKEILRFIETYMIVHGYAPSFREIGMVAESDGLAVVARMVIDGLLESEFACEDRAIRVPGLLYAKSEYMMVCDECDGESPSGSKYCRHCGRKFILW